MHSSCTKLIKTNIKIDSCVIFIYTCVAFAARLSWTCHQIKFFCFQNLRSKSLKFSKSPPLNPIQWELSNNTKSSPKFSYNFEFWFRWIFSGFFFWFQYSITSPLWVKTLWNNSIHPLHTECFPMVPRVARGIMVREMSMWQTSKTNKLLPSMILKKVLK